MSKLKAEGKVRWIGVSNFDVSQMERAATIAPVTSNQPPYSIIRRKIEQEILPHCLKNGIGVISYAPMASGLLTGAMTRERAASLSADDFRSRNPEFKEPNLSKNLELVDRLRLVGARHGCGPGAVAIGWVPPSASPELRWFAQCPAGRRRNECRRFEIDQRRNRGNRRARHSRAR
jgi:aryl-alcohol dehydrogenase-like predicted oxidoreductase